MLKVSGIMKVHKNGSPEQFFFAHTALSLVTAVCICNHGTDDQVFVAL
jgi:hypothetical protein